MRCPFVVLCASFTLAGLIGACTNELVCDQVGTTSLNVSVRDAQTLTRICDATVVATDGDYRETLHEIASSDCFYAGAEERTGTYHLEVARAGYLSKALDGVIGGSRGRGVPEPHPSHPHRRSRARSERASRRRHGLKDAGRDRATFAGTTKPTLRDREVAPWWERRSLERHGDVQTTMSFGICVPMVLRPVTIGSRREGRRRGTDSLGTDEGSVRRRRQLSARAERTGFDVG